WLVDPNDGTSAYLRGFRGSAVSVAAVRDGVPVLGVVFSFASPDDRGDLFAWAEGCGPLSRNGRPLTAERSAARLEQAAAGAGARDADRDAEGNSGCVSPARFVALPSVAYRLALVAAGEAVAGVSLSGPGDWDYAAGDALLRSVGGVVLDQGGREVTYGAEMRRTRHGFGGAPQAVRELVGRPWGLVGGRHRGVLAELRPGEAVADA